MIGILPAKMKISNANQPPWFDSETFQICRENELLRAKYKEPNSSPNYYAKFSEHRRAFRRLTEQKMRDNILTDDNSSDLRPQGGVRGSKMMWGYN